MRGPLLLVALVSGGCRRTEKDDSSRKLERETSCSCRVKSDSYRLLCFWKETEDEKSVKGDHGNPTQQNCTSVDHKFFVLMANAAFRDTHTLLVVRDDEGHSLSAAVDSVAFPGRADLTEDH